MILNSEIKTDRARVIAERIDLSGAMLQMLDSSNNLLVSLSFKNPCALQIANGVLLFANLDQEMVTASGDAVKAKIVDNEKGEDLALLTVTDMDGNGDLKLQRQNLYSGDLFTVQNWTVTEL